MLCRLVISFAVALCSLAFGSAAAGGAATFTDPSFESVPLASGLDLPTNVAWAPDGRMFITEKEGYVRVVQPDGTLLPSPIIDIHDHVVHSGDRGLIGIATAPPVGGDIRLYLLYDHGPPSATTTTVATATLTSITVHADNMVVGGTNGVDPTEITILGSVNSPGTTYGSACASENIDCIPADGFTHSIGTVLVDPNDGSLWVGSGDGANDYGDESPTPSTLHLRAQDPESLAGKILHVHSDGTGFGNSPFCPSDTNLNDNCTKVWGMGFRNPFRFALRQLNGSSVPVVGDVGEGHWEKLDLLDSRGFNAGWPCYEGNAENPDFASSSQCATLGSAYNHPLFVYTHYGDECLYPNPPTLCNQNQLGAAVAAATVYDGATYPAADAGKLFIADYVHGWLSTIDMANPPTLGVSSGTGMPLFAQHLGELVDATQAPDGNLVYVTLSVNSETANGLGTVRKIRFAPTDKSPVAVPTADSSCVDSSTSSRQVSFSGDDSYDPDGDTHLGFNWDFGDGSSSNQPDPVHTYAADGDYEARLTVTDSHGNSASDFLAVHIHQGQSGQPGVSVSAPSEGEQYLAGTNAILSGGTTTGGAFMQWQVAQHDGGTLVGSLPPIETDITGDANFQTAPSPGPNVYYLVHFVVNTGPCRTTITKELDAQTGHLNLTAQDQAANPLAVPLTFGVDQPTPTPVQLTVVKNMVANLTAPQTFIDSGYTYTFSSWSDGGPATHQVQPYPNAVGNDPQTLTATYTKSDQPPVASIDAPADGSMFVSGQQIIVHGSATDPEDGAEPGERLAWTIARHANGTESTVNVPNGSTATFTPDGAGDPNATYSISLTATDSHGVPSAPTTITLHIAQPGSNPSGSGGASGASSGSSQGGSGSMTGIPNPIESLTAVPPRIGLDRLKSRPNSLSGTVRDPVGISSLRLAISPQGIRGKGCVWWSTKRRRLVHVAQSCTRPSWLVAHVRTASGTVRWTLPLGAHLPRGRYLLLVRAVDRAGRISTRLEGNPSGKLTVR
ncbi:MAG: PQQ-dependent sugar dehydrogenase [Solirubrobacteraceae bacterium]